MSKAPTPIGPNEVADTMDLAARLLAGEDPEDPMNRKVATMLLSTLSRMVAPEKGRWVSGDVAENLRRKVAAEREIRVNVERELSRLVSERGRTRKNLADRMRDLAAMLEASPEVPKA
jgi:hypothetical protein